MAVLTDFHLHSSFSGDSDTPMEDMVQRGLALGLKEMCFTEHMDMDYVYENPKEAGAFELSTGSYRQAFLALREKYRDRIRLLFGVELGVQAHIAEKLKTYVAEYDFDFVIASSHLCNGRDPYFPSFYEGRSEEEAYAEYFACVLANLKVLDDFDVYGHLDYVVRYGPHKDRDYSYERYRELLDAILSLLVEREKGLEINTGAIPCGLRELNPCAAVIRRYRELGGSLVSIGSDAHTPDRIAFGFHRAEEILKSCGFRYYTVFENRKPQYRKL